MKDKKRLLKTITTVVMSIGIVLTFLTVFFNIPFLKKEILIPITIIVMIVYYKFFFVKVKPNEKFRDPIVRNYPENEKKEKEIK